MGLMILVLVSVYLVAYLRFGDSEGTWAFRQSNRVSSVAIDTSMAPLYVVREGPITRAIARLGIADEAQVGDRGLDDVLFVASDLPEQRHAALANPAVLLALSTLFQKYEVSRVVALRGVLSARLPGLEARDSAVADGVRQELQALAEALRVEGQHVSPLGPWALAAIVAHLAAAGAAVGLVAAEWWDPVVYVGLSFAECGLLAFAALGAVSLWLGLLFARFSRSAWVVVVLIDFLAWGGAGISGSVIAGALRANTAFDTSPPEQASAAVIGRRCEVACSGSRRKDSHYDSLSEAECLGDRGEKALEKARSEYSSCRSSGELQRFITVAPWAGNSAEGEMQVSSTVWADASPGASVQIPMRDGALGLDWYDVSGVTVGAPARPKPAPIIPPGADPSTWRTAAPADDP